MKQHLYPSSSKLGAFVFFFFILLLNGWVEAQTIIATKGKNGKNGSSHLVVEENNQKIKIEYEGQIHLGPDDKTIESITEGGYMRIEKTTFGNSRELFINSRGSGLEYEYKEGGRTREFEPAGRTWLAEIIPELLRTTTIGAESRVNRLYQKGGAKEVLKELPEQSDYVRARYLELLLGKNLKQNEIDQIITAVGQQVRSDHYRYEIFKNNHQLLFAETRHQDNYLKAVETIKSDHYKSLLLQQAVKSQPVNAQQQKLIELIGTVNSDHYKTEILKDLSRNELGQGGLNDLLTNLVPKISSDHYRNEVLRSILRGQKLSEDQVQLLVRSSKNIKSDHYKSVFLKEVCAAHGGEKVKQTIREEAKSIKSTHYFGEVMRCAS